MKSVMKPGDQKWIAQLKREADQQLPPFSESFHNQIIQQIIQHAAEARTGGREPARGRFPRLPIWGLAAAAIVLVVSIPILTHLAPRPATEQKQTAPAVDISSLMPNPAVLINQAAMQWQDQFYQQPSERLQIQARQLGRYVIHDMDMF